MIKLEVDIGTKVGTINRQEVNTQAWNDGMKEKRPLGEEASLQSSLVCTVRGGGGEERKLDN